MGIPSLKVAAAEYVLGLIPLEALPAVADSLVDVGTITPSIAELASHPAEDAWEVGQLFEDSLRELGGGLPNRDEAVETVLRDRLKDVVSAPCYPQAELERLLEVFYMIRDGLPDDDLLWPLYGDADAVVMAGDPPRYRGAIGERALKLIDADVREDAQAWLDAHGTA